MPNFFSVPGVKAKKVTTKITFLNWKSSIDMFAETSNKFFIFVEELVVLTELQKVCVLRKVVKQT